MIAYWTTTAFYYE